MNFFQNMSLKYKLVLLILSVTLLSLIIGFTINIFREYALLKEKMVNESIMNAKLVSEYCITPLDFGYQDEAQANLSKLETIPAVFNAIIFDVKGNLFASYSRIDTVTAPPIPDSTSYIMFSGEWLHVFRTIKFNEEKKGTIYLRVSTAELSEGLNNHLISIVIISLGMMIIAYFLAIVMQRFISRPILTLADITERISQKADYTVQIERKSSDEIGTLYKSFNNMLEQIHIREMERDEAEEEKTRLTGILENTTDLVSMAAPDASLFYMNPAGLNMLGWTAEANIRNKTIPQAHPEWAIKIINDEAIPAAIEEGVWQGETAVTGPKGKEIPVLQVIISHKSPDGELKYLSTIMRDISERKQAEKALQESEKLYRQAIDNADAIAYKLDFASNSYSFIGEGIFSFTGYHSEELTEEIWSILVQECVMRGNCAGLTEAEARELNRDGKLNGWQADFRIQRKDGNERWLADSSVLLKDEEGSPVGSLGVLQDITERKLAEEALRKSQAFNETLLNTSPDIIYIYDIVDQRNIYTNSGITNVLGYSIENIQAMGKNLLSQIMHPDDFMIYLNETVPRYQTAKDGEFIEHEYRMQHKGGAWCWLYCKESIFMRLNDGTPKHIFGVVSDITERKQTEEELRHLRNYLSNIIDSMPSVLAGVDADGRVTQWNKTAVQTTGISAETAQGKLLSDVLPHMSSEMEKITESIRTRQIKQEQKRPRAAEKGVLFEDITIYPLISNGAQGAVIRIDDMTSKVHMEEMMIQSEKMLSVGGLAAGMAHEINNPLAGMMQTASVMKDRLTNLELAASRRAAEKAGTSLEAVHEFMKARGIIKMLERIGKSGSRAAEIVSNMLSFARKSGSSFSTRNLAELLDQTVDLAGSDYDLKKKFDFRQIEIVRDYEKNLSDVSCEGSKIQQVLLNILRNSAEAVNERKNDSNRNPRLVLRLANEKDRGLVRIEIEDNGPGMNEEIRKRVFEPFFTTKSTESGTGLGLSVSYFIITENHGGEMSVESVPGEGTTFIIKLPVERGKL